jgi:hypothetical protein
MARLTSLDAASRSLPPAKKPRLSYTHSRARADTDKKDSGGEPEHMARRYAKAASAKEMIRG